jgi:hypothetical protein
MRELFDLPREMAALPRDYRGYPIPSFVYFDKDGKEDFRIIKTGWREECHNKHRCWLCGGFMGKRKWFVLGPMCSVTRTTMEPPCHRLCAEFAVKNCPFLTKPMAKRRDLSDVGEHHVDGTMIERNPGVSIIWETLTYKPFRTGDGWLITVGDPTNVTAWREGRHATRDEVLESVQSGIPLLHEEAEKEGQAAINELFRTVGEWSNRVLDRWFPSTLNSQRGARA